jgi:hypothetical protein
LVHGDLRTGTAATDDHLGTAAGDGSTDHADHACRTTGDYSFLGPGGHAGRSVRRSPAGDVAPTLAVSR